MPEINKHMYLFVTEFEVYTVSYKPIISPLIYGPRVKNVGHKLKVKNQFIVQTMKTWVVRFHYISAVCDRLGNDFLFTWNGLKVLLHIESARSQFLYVLLHNLR